MMPPKTIACFALLVITLSWPARAQSGSASEDIELQLQRAKGKVLSDTYQLQYQFGPGEMLRYQVEHLATVDTTIQGNRQTSKSRSVSTKVWKIEQVNDGQIRLVHRIEDVDMWSQVDGRQPVRYASRDNTEPPAEYQAVAETLGKPLSVVTISPFGRILKRTDKVPQINFGVGGLIVPLPEEPVKIGDTWSVPSQLRVSMKDGQPKLIKTRQQYKLTAVKTGVATITVQTQVLTPVHDARVRSQLLQKMTSGQIKFDVDAGRIMSKDIQWDESVIGFNGPDSNMKYLAKFTEKLIHDRVAKQENDKQLD